MVSTDNTIKSWIEQRRNVLSHAAKGPWQTGGWGALLSADNEQLLAGTATSEGYVQDEADESAIIDSHNMFPRALNALEQVLELHKPAEVFTWAEDCADPENHHLFTDVRTGDMLCEDEPIGRFCNGCVPENDTTIDVDEYPWPCVTVQAIEGAINHE